MYENGRGLAKDAARAAELYRQACDGEDAEGCRNLAALYEHAIGVEHDRARALALYRQALELGLDADTADAVRRKIERLQAL
jgi:TPR repeat protein